MMSTAVSQIPTAIRSTGSDICPGTTITRVENRSGVIEQQDLDFHNIKDGSEAVEHVARTTIAEQMAKGQVELIASFFAEDVEKIKDRTYKMWLPGMKVRDEKGRPAGLLAFQLFGVSFLIMNIKSPACGGFLCDDMGLGETIQGPGRRPNSPQPIATVVSSHGDHT
jgi:hypothetical protein